MLNAELVEKFHAVFRQKMTGTLTVAGDDFNVRFLFQEGEFMAMDLGEDKEHVLADKLMEYHRIDATQHATVFATREKVQGTVDEIVRNLHMATDAELKQSARAMVEDALCNVFASEVRHLHFTPGQGVESFNFERSSVRLRIPVETLLKTVDQRVSDNQEVKRSVGNWDAVFAFAEGGEDAGALTDFEKHVLNFVDGHRSVEDIASGCRDSSLNLARVLHGLARKGVVRKVAAGTRAVKTGSGPVTGAPASPGDITVSEGTAESLIEAAVRREASAAVAAVTPAAPPAVSTHPAAPAPEEPAAAPLPPIPTGPSILGIGLRVVAAGIIIGGGFLIWQRYELGAQVDAARQKISDYTQKKEWTQAAELEGNLRSTLGEQHPDWMPKIDEIQGLINDALTRELASIDSLVSAERFDEARKLVVDLPADLPGGQTHDGVLAKLNQSQDDFNHASAQLASDVTSALDAGEAATANRLIAGRSAHMAALAVAARESWRSHRIEDADSPSSAIAEREGIVKLVRAASPDDAPLTAEQIATLARIESQIRQARAELEVSIAKLQALAGKGSYQEVLDQADKDHLASLAHGDPVLEKSYEDLLASCALVKDAFRDFRADAMAAVKSEGGPQALIGILAHGQQLLKDYPAESNLNDDQGFIDHLKSVSDALQQPAELQGAAFTQLMDLKLEPELRAAIKSRLDAIAASESEAASLLETARRHVREGDYAAAIKVYDQLISRPDWSGTAQHRTAVEEVATARKEQGRILAGKADLAAAIASGDYDKATEIARTIGLKYLPLVVDSSPSGAEVWQGGKKIGVTPFIADISAADRTDYTIEVHDAGFMPATLSGAAAEGGWHLHAVLERSPDVSVDIGQQVTAHPVASGDRVWTANRDAAFAIGLSGTITTELYQGPGGTMPLNEPVYGQIQASPQGMLVPTRENVVMRIGKTVERLPLGGPTDLAVAVYESQELLDTRFLIAAGTDGRLHALVESRPSQHWDAGAGEVFAAAPVVVGEEVLAVRRDGMLDAVRCYDGQALGHAEIGAKVIAAWATPTGLSGITAADAWSWDGKQLEHTALPLTAQGGGPDALLGQDGSVWIHQTADWKSLGHLAGTPTSEPLAWQGEVAVACGQTVQVVGEHGFSAKASTDFLAPVAIGAHLVLISQDGKVRIYSP